MYKNNLKFGIHVHNQTIGEAWINLVKAVLDMGTKSYDEGRERIALQNVRIKSQTQNLSDKILDEYGNQENIKAMVDLTFNNEVMKDIDIIKSFKIGANSYCKRIKDGKMLDFVIKRLNKIPESKKAVMVFPNNKDYEAILKNHDDDYLPCLVIIQFRLTKKDGGFILNTNFYSRSMDIYQKGHGNLVSIVKLSEIVARGIEQGRKKEVKLGFLDGMIADVHIYKETLKLAKKMIAAYQKNKTK